MKEVGISVYPEKADLKANLNYIRLASKYGFKRIFINLISLENDLMLLSSIKKICSLAKGMDMKVVADVTPKVFKTFNASPNNLKSFYDLGLCGIRLDSGFTGLEKSIMTFNPYGIKIELNMSSGTKDLEAIMEYEPNLENLLGCHNFYPLKYTGISREQFTRCSEAFKKLGIKTAAFVTSPTATFGAWPDNDGLCTLEEHRNLSIETQTKDLFNTRLIDTVIIGDCFASEKEMKAIGKMDKNLLTFNIELNKNISGVEKKIVLDELHCNRGDVSEYVIRSTQSRIKYRGYKFEVSNPNKMIKRGDILIKSSLYQRYAGELQIALRDMQNNGKTNVVGRITQEEVYLLDHLRPWQKFELKLK